MSVKLLTVIPIIKGISKELSYFSSKDIKKGALISISLRQKEVPALVLSAKEVKDAKSLLRNSPYPLKRIANIKTPAFFTPEFIKAAQKSASYFLSSTGSVIKKLCPQIILQNPPSLTIRAQKRNEKPGGVSLLQANQEERLKFYKNLIRAEFARQHSVFLCLPSSLAVKRYEEQFKKGIEQYVVALHGKMSKKELIEKWTKILIEKHPLLIVGTSLFLSLPKNDIKTIIIEKEGSSLFKEKIRPYLDIRTVVENIIIETKSSLILADEIIRTETYAKKQSAEISLALPVAPKTTLQSEQILVDMRELKNIISSELKETLESAQKNNERLLLFINRRGHGLSTICQDCGQIILCGRCETPLVLHQNTSRSFVCHKCLLQTEVGERCPYCQSWRLQTFGYGIQKISEEIQKLFPNFKIFRLDSDIAKTKKQAEEIIKNYLNTSGSILLTTEMFFSYWNGQADRVAVVSLDGLFSLPDFRINERIFRLLFQLKAMARKTFLIQTRLPNHPVFNTVLKGDLDEFYKSELNNRKMFGYPPFKTLIKIALEGKDKIKLEKEAKDLEQKLASYNPVQFSAFTPKIKNIYRLYLLLKLESGTWPHKHPELHQLLSSLPPQWKIDVDPESLL